MRRQLNPINLAVLLVLVIMFVGATTDEQETGPTAVVEAAALPPADSPVAKPAGGSAEKEITAVVDSPAIIAPYTNYFITQGHHGVSYGHWAIDLSAGKEADILAPISGDVTQLYYDEWNNPTLVIENARFQVTLLHGDYTVAVGDRVRQGELVGYESNLGYTTDLNGIRCVNGRECGYHTHLNVYDKQLQANVDPFIWIEYRDWDDFKNQ